MPEAAEREVLCAKWADFSGNISSYVVRVAATAWWRPKSKV